MDKIYDVNKTKALQEVLLSKYSNLVRVSPEDLESLESVVDAIDNYYTEVIACMPGNVYWLDKHAICVGCNQNVADMFGLKSPKALKGLSFEEMAALGNWTSEAMQFFKQDTLEVVRTGKAKLNIEEPPIPNQAGQLIYFLTSRVPLLDAKGEVAGVVGISIDITERKKMEEQLRVSKRLAEAANRAKSEFLLNMSHDIKTPLSGILSFAEYLSSQVPEHLREFSQDILGAGKQLMQFFENCMELSKLESHSITLQEETFSVEQLLHEILTLLRPAIKAKDLGLYVNYAEKKPLYFLGSRVTLYRILLNLVGNAVKFTQEGSITVGVELDENTTSDTAILKFTVADTGIGIPTNKQRFIFEKFSRITPSYEGVYEGQGIGLYIVREFVEAMGGVIHLKSKEKRGSEFTVLIPLKEASLIDNAHTDVGNDEIKLDALQILPKHEVHPTETKHTKETGDFYVDTTSQLHILVVEDSSFAKKAMQRLFDAEGCHIDLARSGQDAIGLFTDKKYDLVFIDVGLLDMKSDEVARCLRKIEKGRPLKVPILGFSAYLSAEEVKLSLEGGMNEVLTKPLLADQAEALLQRYNLKKVCP
jgi:two-component system aerobic respiration control sensor histidine kinase ArcB